MRIFSAVQPTGLIHIGNYLGAIKQWVKLQNENECFFCIADLHSLTVPYEPKDLKMKILETLAVYLAVGVNPEKSVLFVQSHIKEHTELLWLLSVICPVGELQRMTQYKDKAKQFKNNVNAGLLNYPILMASDILLYKTEKVPIGKDQMQHLELARTLARRFNKRFGKVFLEPQAILPEIGAKIMALDNPKKKMSKTGSPENYISLFESPKMIEKKIFAAVTDSEKNIKYNLSKKQGISNLLTIYSLFSEEPIKEIEKKFKNKSYREFKKSLIRLLVEKLEPFRKKKKELISRQVYIEEVLKKGAERARRIAFSTMEEVKQKMGLYQTF